MKIVIAVLIVLLFALNVQLWRTDGKGVRQVRALQVAVAKQQAHNATLEERNKALEAEVRSLKQDLEAIEERARVDLGMIQKGETFFHVLESRPEPRAEASESERRVAH
jgi:cell division protein FtsB